MKIIIAMALKVNIDKCFIRHNFFLFFFVVYKLWNTNVVKKSNTVCFWNKYSLNYKAYFKDVIQL